MKISILRVTVGIALATNLMAKSAIFLPSHAKSPAHHITKLHHIKKRKKTSIRKIKRLQKKQNSSKKKIFRKKQPQSKQNQTNWITRTPSKKRKIIKKQPNFNHTPQPPQENTQPKLKKYRRLLVLNDLAGDELKDTWGGIMMKLLDAIQEKEFPILVSIPTFKSALKICPWTTCLFPCYWYAFVCPGNNYLLLIPRNYLKLVTGSDFLHFTSEEESILGFQLKNLSPMKLQSWYSDSEREQFKNNIPMEKTTFDINSLKKVFVEQTPETSAFKWNIVAAGHGGDIANSYYRVGLPQKNFIELLDFFNTYIHTNFLYYFACHGGHPRLVEMFKKAEKPNTRLRFPIASAAITNALIAGHGSGFTYQNFFQKLEAEQPFDLVLHEINIQKGVVPKIRFPGTDWFSLIKGHNKIVSISQPTIMKHLIENKPLKITDTVQLLYLCSNVISIPLILSHSEENLTIIPHEFGHNKKTYFTQITVNDLPSLLHILFLNYVYSKPYEYFIKKLITSSGILHNVLIQHGNQEIYVVYTADNTNFQIDHYHYKNVAPRHIGIRYQLIPSDEKTTVRSHHSPEEWVLDAEKIIVQQQESAQRLSIITHRLKK